MDASALRNQVDDRRVAKHPHRRPTDRKPFSRRRLRRTARTKNCTEEKRIAFGALPRANQQGNQALSIRDVAASWPAKWMGRYNQPSQAANHHPDGGPPCRGRAGVTIPFTRFAMTHVRHWLLAVGVVVGVSVPVRADDAADARAIVEKGI